MPYIGNTAGNRFVASQAATRLSGNGSATAFTLEHSVASDEDILVSVDGVIQEPSIAYSVSNGTTLTFTGAPSNGTNNIFVCYLFRTVATVDHPSTSSLQATDATFTGAFTSKGIDDNADATAITIDSSEHVGIGTTSPDGTLHIHSASAGSVTANTEADELVVENSGNGGVSILTPDSNRSAIFLGHASDNLKLQIRHDGATSLGQIISDDALTFNVGDGTERMRIDANGHITMPTQPAFSAKVSSQMNNFSNNTDVAIEFDSEIFDQNDDYNTTNYTFTAPVTGKYQLNVSLLVMNLDSAAAYYQTKLTTSNRIYYHTIDADFGQDNVYYNLDVCVLADMDAGDTATVAIFQSGGTSGQSDINSVSYFTGFLVC